MDLILLRHGQAEPFNPGGDASRVLTAKGEKQSVRAGRFLLGLDDRPEVVLSSPRVRCVQTAEAFCEAAEMPGPVIQAWIDCGMTPDILLSELTAFRDFSSVLIVGHEPDLSSFVEYVLGAGAGVGVEFKKGTLAALSMQPSGRGAILRYILPSKLIRRFKAKPVR